MSDYQCQLVAIETMEATAGADYVDPRLVSKHSVAHAQSNGRFQCSHKPGVQKEIFTIPYLLHAYNVADTFIFQEKCERYELKIDYVAMDQVCTWSHY